MGRLDDKVAIMTGGASGFGEAMARRFAAEGAKIVVADLNAKGAERVAGEIGSAAISVADRRLAAGRVRRDGRCRHGCLRPHRHHGQQCRLHPPQRRHARRDEETFDLITAVNMKAIYHAALAVVPIMERQGGGVILTTASTAGLRPRPGLTWYNASKGWAITATKSMAVELAPKNIRVNCLCPVAGETRMLANVHGRGHAGASRAVPRLGAAGSAVDAADIANAALYLVSDEAEFITGVALEVDGGRCI